ncbi:sensor histidine kinase [Kocuria rosea]|uniref:sensor histidine kinase n=1 Tax=Kocuria rosea TaxID=1275 RepID=UPI002B2406E7|nr:ATP-binding protein [Kocuria rosea]MEB2526498.1 ATP-binding protein [Kocuria rosea]MEB2619229.1 ATP-binding protein [Kocuria rosea]
MDPLAAHPSPVPWQFHELSLRGRVVVSQLPQAVTTFLLFLVLAVVQAPLLADPLVRWAGGLTLALTLACALVPWDRLPYRSYLVIPVLDFVPIGLLFEGLFPQVLGVPFLAALPVLWLVASAQLPRAAAPLGALLTVAMLWVPLLLRPGPVTLTALGSPLLIPLMMLAIGTMAQILTNSTEAKDAQLRHLLAAGARRERLLSTVLDSVDVGVLALDEAGRPLLTNNGHLHAHAQQRLVGTSSSSAIPVLYDGAGAPLSSTARPIARAVAGESFSADLVRVGEPPAQQVLSVTARVMRDEHGRAEGSVLSFSDVTELVDALQAKDEFVAGISHELRTPLTSIRGYTELLAMDDRLPAAAQTGLEVIERNADQLLSLVDDLLNSHRDAADLHIVPADLVALLEQSAEAARPHADRAGIAVKAWAPDTLVVDCDPVRMRQVLDNLISNAIKYSPANSTVFVLGTWSGDSAQVQVIDHGHGMSPEDVRRVFEKFYRGATARMSTTPGLGIGLALSKAIIEQHRGTLECHSTLGEGTVFTLALPMTSPQDVAPAAEIGRGGAERSAAAGA